METKVRHHKPHNSEKLDPARGKVLPAIPIAWAFIYQNELDDNPLVIHDTFDLWKVLTDLQHDFRSRIELHYEEVDQAFVLIITLNSTSLEDAYRLGVTKGKQIAFRHSNRIGFVEEDEEGLVWLSH